MNYFDFCVGDKSYKLRLTTRTLILLERKFGRNPLEVLIEMNGAMPRIEDMVTILQHSLWACHEAEFKDIEKVYDLFDEYIAEKSTIDFLEIITGIFEVSGLLPKDEINEEIEEKK